MISPRIELGTFCVLSRCHNQLDHETKAKKTPKAPDSGKGGELGIEPRTSRMLVFNQVYPVVAQSENHTTRPHALTDVLL